MTKKSILKRQVIAAGLAVTFAVSTLAPASAVGQSSAPVTWSGALSAKAEQPVIQIHKIGKRHSHKKRRRAAVGAAVAGAVLLGILGAAAAKANDGHDDDFVDYDDRNLRRNWRACEDAVHYELREEGGRRIRVRNPDEVVYLSPGRHRIFGRAKARGVGRVDYRCTAKRGRVQRLRIY